MNCAPKLSAKFRHSVLLKDNRVIFNFMVVLSDARERRKGFLRVNEALQDASNVANSVTDVVGGLSLILPFCKLQKLE